MTLSGDKYKLLHPNFNFNVRIKLIIYHYTIILLYTINILHHDGTGFSFELVSAGDVGAVVAVMATVVASIVAVMATVVASIVAVMAGAVGSICLV